MALDWDCIHWYGGMIKRQDSRRFRTVQLMEYQKADAIYNHATENK